MVDPASPKRLRTDRHFDSLAERFRDSIYGTLKGRIRLEVLNRDFAQCLPQLQAGAPLKILDAGGGSGQFSAALATQGHVITLADPSAAMLAQARQEYALRCPAAEVRFLHHSVQTLPAELEGEFDLILFHAVLEWLAEPHQTLLQLLRFLRPGGQLSLLFYNRTALEFRHLTLGNFYFLQPGRLGGRGEKTLTPHNPQSPDEVAAWFSDLGYSMLEHSGVRCFYDYMSPREAARVKDDEVVEMELRQSRREPFRSLARYAHFLLAKPDIEAESVSPGS